MSAEDFQTKYASVMESMLKSAIAETTKLFETMVDDLKAEISRIKKENEDLKTRCSLFEKGKSQTRESESSPRSSDGSEKRDTAVQCDLVPFRTMLVEQCLPLRNSSVEQEQEQCSYEEMEYGLQEHNYETHSQMAFILVKQEELYDDSSLQSIMKQEEVEPANACGKASNAGLPQATAFGTENEGRGTIPEKNGEIQVALELPCLGMHRGFQRAPNQSSEPEQALVISFTAINDGMEDETREGLVTSGEQSVMTVQQQSLVSQQRQRETESTTHCKEEPLAQPKPQNKEVACEDFKSGIAEVEATLSQPLRRRRGRPPKKAKHLQRPVKPPSTDVTTEQMVANSPSIIVEEVEISTNTSSFITPNTASGDVESIKVGALAVSVASVSRECSTEKKKTPESQQQAVEKESASTQDSSATETLNSTPAESRQAPSVHPRVRRTSVTLQDAMLLVEAMNQSPEENTISSSKRMAAPPQSQRATRSRTLQTVDEVVAEPQMPPFPTQSRETAGKLPIESAAQSTIKGARPQITNSTPSNEAQACIKGVVPKQQHAVTHPFNTASQPMPSSTAATQTCIRSQLHLPYPLQTSAAASEQSNAVPHKIIVVPRSVPSLICNKIAELCPTKLPTFASTVVAAQNNNLNPPSPAAHLPVGTPSFSPVPKKRIYVSSRKLLPVVLSQSTAASTDQQPGILPHPNMTITIPRHGQAVASRTPQPILISRKRASAEPAGAVTLSSSQLLSPSQELTFSVEAQTTSDKMASISSQKWDNTTDHKESTKQTETLSDFTTNAPTETCPSLKTGLVPASLSQVEQKLCPMVRLTKLPFSVLIKESVLVSKVLPNGCSETQPLWKEGSTQEKLLSADISTKPSEVPLVAPDICPSLKEASVSTQTPQMSKEQNNIQEIALSSDTCTVLGESYVSVYEHPSTPPKMIASVLEKSAEPSASNVVEEIFSKAMQGCALPNGFPTEDKESADLVQLTSNKSKDLSDPESHLTKTQFLAQLAVLPVIPAPEKASSNDCADNRAPSAETCNTGQKRLQKKSLVAQLQSHFKTHVQTRGTKRNPEPCTEIETTSVSHKRLGSKNNSPNYKQVTNKPDPISPKKPGVVEDMTSLNKTTNDHVPNSLRRTGRCKGAFRPKRSVSEPTRRSKATRESTPRRCSSGRDGIGSKNTKSTSVSPQRSSPSKDDDHPRNTKNGTSPKNIKSTSVSAKRTGLTREGASLKKTEHSAVSPGTSSLSENGTSPKLSAHELIYINRTRSTFTQDSSNTKQIKRESSSFSPLRRTTGTAIAKTKSETYSPSIRWPQLAKDGELTPAKKIARLIQDGTTPKKNARILNARKLAKAAKAKTIAKMQKGAKTGQLTEGQVSCDVLKKYKAKAVWIPPKITASKTPSASAKRPCLLHVKKETRSPKSQNHSIVYPPSVSLQPIPVKAPPIISPLQPLSVIGGRLLKNQCGECGRVLSSSAALESHVSLHTGRRPYSCTLCGKSFPDPKGLKRHGRVHRNGRIHICQQCGKGFVYSFGLTKHLQMVHSRIKPFVCQICNKGFYTKRDVEAHIRIHTGEKPFHCNLCEKKFTRRVELNVHLRWHNGEKRHWCPFCGKGFLDLNNLKRHKYIHTGEKPHSCPHCPKHFTQSGHLKKHVKNVHKIQ